MSVKVENLEKNMAKLTIEVAVEEVDKAIEAAYQKQKKSISMQGFRKGKVPKAMVEKMYGVEVFYEDAANILMQNAYPTAMDESGLDIVSQPTVDVVQLEKGKSFIFTAEVAVKPEVELGTYKGVTVAKADTSVKAAEVNAEVEKEREANARTVSVTDRGVKKDDITIIDFEGFIDGTPFEGGKGENHELLIGSHSFIDTFEDQLVGKNVGEDVEVNVSFPEDYHAAELAGKPALFKVKIHEIKVKELPKLDDEFAQDISEFDTLKEYKADLKKKMVEEKERAAKRAQEDEAIQAIIDDSKMDIPEPMLQLQCQQLVDGMAQQMAQQGLSMDQYFQFTGTSIEQLMEQVKPEATNRIKASLVLEAIAAKEQFEISEEEVEAEIAKMAEMYHMEVEKIKEIMGENEKESIKRDLSIQAAVNLITENMKVKAPAKDETAEVESDEE
ncbi:MAG: trigger factor [Lachnospiraceae bacterium]|nr:trigger factor [Lachnospiraceae bacterium]